MCIFFVYKISECFSHIKSVTMETKLWQLQLLLISSQLLLVCFGWLQLKRKMAAAKGCNNNNNNNNHSVAR